MSVKNAVLLGHEIMWPGGYLPMFSQKHVATPSIPPPTIHVPIFGRSKFLLTLSKSVKDCMLHIPRIQYSSQLPPRGPKNSHRCVTVHELCNGVEIRPRLLSPGLTCSEFLQNWFLHHSIAFLVNFLCLRLNVWQMWHDLCHL